MLRRNAALKITALLLAVFLWFYVRLTEENPFVEKPLTGVELDVRDLPAGLARVGKPPTVEVVVRGPKGTLESAAAQVQAWVSLKGARPGAITVPVQLRIPEPLTRVRLRPQRVSLRLERQVTRTLPVEYYLLGSAPPGYAIGDPRLRPAEVKISGLARDVERVAHALVSVDVASARIGITRSAEVRAVDAQGSAIPMLTIEPKRVRVTVPVTRVDVYRTVPVVLRTAGSVADGYRVAGAQVKPAVVTIAGDAARIEAVGYVETEALDLGGAAASISRAVRLVTPRGVTALGAQQVAVDVEIVKE